MNGYTNPNLERIARLRRIRKMKRRRRIVISILLIIIVILIGSLYSLGKKLFETETVSTQTEIEEVQNTGDEVKPDSKNKPKTSPKKKNKDTKKEPEDKTKFKAGDYSSHYCYEKNKQARYESYHAKNPSRSVDEVVWQVNANLDKPFYGYDIPAGDINDPLVIVNKYYKVDSSQKPTLTTADGYSMTPATADAYKRMKADAAAEGLSILAASTYRSVEYQRDLYNSYLNTDPKDVVDTYSARAGYSEHHTGMAIDFIGSFGSLNDFENTNEYPWVRDNCHRYGFIIRYTADNQWITGYKNEPWHLRYIGVKAATDMKEKGISSFEEYKVKYIDHQP